MENKYKIESVLFASGVPISREDLTKICELSDYETDQAIEELLNEYESSNRGFTLIEKQTSGKQMIQLVSNQEASPFISKLNKNILEGELSPTSLETLSIVAYKGPMTRAEIDDIRGANSSYILKTLMIRGLIERYQHPERRNTFLYEVSFDLLKVLGITKTDKLPDFEKLHSLTFKDVMKKEEINNVNNENAQV